jgi:hypothetical protein
LDVVGGDEHVGEGLRQPGGLEPVGQEQLGGAGRVATPARRPGRVQALQQRAAQGAPALVAAEPDQLGGGPGPAVGAGLGQRKREHAAGGGAHHEVEQVGGGAPGALLELGHQHGRDDAAHPAAVDGQHLDDSRHGPPPPAPE